MMNNKGGALVILIYLLLFTSMTLVFMASQGNPTEIPIGIFDWSIPTAAIGVVFILMSIVFGIEPAMLIIGITIIAHYYWFLGALP